VRKKIGALSADGRCSDCCQSAAAPRGIKFYFNGHDLHLITRNNRKFPCGGICFLLDGINERYYFQLRAKVLRFWYVTHSTLAIAEPRVGLSSWVIEPLWLCSRYGLLDNRKHYSNRQTVVKNLIKILKHILMPASLRATISTQMRFSCD
jgi:hypothetical protein